MALEYTVENLDTIEDPIIKSLYEEQTVGDKKVYVLAVNGVKPESEITNLKKALQSERNLKEEKEKALKAFGENTPESIAALNDELNNLRSAKSSTTEADFLARLNEAKNKYVEDLQKAKTEWEVEKLDLENTVKSRESDILNMRLENRFNALFSEKGDASGRELGYNKAKMELEWNAELNDFYTKDGLVSIKEWMDSSLYKNHPCLLKPSLSASARGGDGTTVSYDKYFNPKSAEYSDSPDSKAFAKRAELFRNNREAALALIAKYKQ